MSTQQQARAILQDDFKTQNEKLHKAIIEGDNLGAEEAIESMRYLTTIFYWACRESL